jgi:hypothetical protein
MPKFWSSISDEICRHIINGASKVSSPYSILNENWKF